MKYNTQKLRNLGLASLRHGSGLRETAESASPTLMDFGVVSENDSTITCHARKCNQGFIYWSILSIPNP